ncbi:MAG: response regulator transcription factor [Lewinellaceae bacterium]|nr:response regulator transcription factor [Lewinellaceae bacterium]
MSIFLALCSIGFSFDGKTFFWFWQKHPTIPILLLLFAFFAVRYWLKLEIEKQRQQIQAEYLKKKAHQDQNDFKKLLSPREIEVLELINEGLSNKDIAGKLYVSLSTVKTHINNIYKILEVKTGEKQSKR